MLEKQNTLTFQNITNAMKMKKSKKQGVCFYHNDRLGKYRDVYEQVLYCRSCAIQQASQGAQIQNITEIQNNNSSPLLLIFEKSQKQLQLMIKQYNNKYEKLIQVLTDMQIRDILAFNCKIQQNNKIYRQLSNSYQKYENQMLQKMFLPHGFGDIVEKIDSFIQSFTQERQFSTKDIFNSFSSKNSIHSPKVVKKTQNIVKSPVIKQASPQIIKKNKSQSIQVSEQMLKISHISLQQMKINKNKNQSNQRKAQNESISLKSKSSTMQQINGSLQDTPQSLKGSQKFKVTSQMAVTMFQKIDICESVNMQNKKSNEKTEKQSMNSKNSRYRYFDNQ